MPCLPPPSLLPTSLTDTHPVFWYVPASIVQGGVPLPSTPCLPLFPPPSVMPTKYPPHRQQERGPSPFRTLPSSASPCPHLSGRHTPSIQVRYLPTQEQVWVIAVPILPPGSVSLSPTHPHTSHVPASTVSRKGSLYSSFSRASAISGNSWLSRSSMSAVATQTKQAPVRALCTVLAG